VRGQPVSAFVPGGGVVATALAGALAGAGGFVAGVEEGVCAAGLAGAAG
jgi:hypothetical protein